MRFNTDYFWGGMAAVGCVIAAVIVCFQFFLPKTVNGYYLKADGIWVSVSGDVDPRACSYDEDKWKFIVANDMQYIKK